MKTTVVPAQVTTIEDKIAGNLTFTQILLLTTPVFFSGAIFAFLPPFMNLKSYKLLVCGILAIVCLTLAIRIKGKILLAWIGIIARYNLRPRYYLFNKNDAYLRDSTNNTTNKSKPKIQPVISHKKVDKSEIPLPELVRLENAITDPKANFRLKAEKKGGLRVYIQEIK